MAHEDTYVICENMCLEPGYTKDQVDNLLNGYYKKTETYSKTEVNSIKNDLINDMDGINTNLTNNINEINITLANVYNKTEVESLITNHNPIAILTGQITLVPNETNSIDINYPSGFTADNTVVLGTMTTSGVGANNVYGYPYFGNFGNGRSPNVVLYTDRINFEVYHSLTSGNNRTLNYKIFLMKIS